VEDTETVVDALLKQAHKLPCEPYKSLTWDRGKEMADHRHLTDDRHQGLLLRSAAAVATRIERERLRDTGRTLWPMCSVDRLNPQPRTASRDRPLYGSDNWGDACSAPAETLQMLTRCFFVVLSLSSALTCGLTARVGWTAEPQEDTQTVARALAEVQAGEPLPRISVQEQERLLPSLRTFFGNAEGDTGSPKRFLGVGPSLFEQFRAVMAFPINMFQYRLPSGRVIWAHWDKISGAYAVVVPRTLGSGTIAATALLAHLCPKNGVVDNVRTGNGNGRAFQTKAPCELDYSLMIFYAHGGTPDPNLTADLTKWAQASMEARQQQLGKVDLFPLLDRKLLLKRFVRVLDDRPIDLSVVDAVFPLNAQAVAAF
jgi:hypothetical protein